MRLILAGPMSYEYLEREARTHQRLVGKGQQPLTTELPSITLDVSQQAQANAYTSRSTYVRGSPLAEFSSK